MKKCPYCAEEIQDDALKCRFCGEFLSIRPKEKWYFKTYWLVIAVLSVGPLALPLVWFNPKFNKTKKIIISLIVIVLTYYFTMAAIKSLKNINTYYQQLVPLF